MIAKLISYTSSISPIARRFIWKRAYQAINKKFMAIDWYFLNYGYDDLNPAKTPLILEEKDEPDRYFIQLYHHVAGATKLEGKDVLEIGSGRGGGSSYIARYLKPRTMIGVDLSARAVAYCNTNHRAPGLFFKTGDSESLPCQNHTFHAIINVESSHCYGSMDNFLVEVDRVLKPGGYFLWADFREEHRTKALQASFENSPLRILKKENITPQVLRALDGMSERKTLAIEEHIPKMFLHSMREFAGVRGSAIYNAFKSGQKLYWHYVCQKGG